MIVKVKRGYKVVSETTGKHLGDLSKTKAEAKRRLRQMAFFKCSEEQRKSGLDLD